MKRLWLVLAAVFVVMVGYGVALTVLPYYAARVHDFAAVNDRTLAFHIGLLTSVYALAQLVASPLIGRAVDAVGRRPVLLAGLVGMATTQTLFGLVPRLWILYLLRVAGGVATAAMIVAATAVVADLTSETDRPRGMAWYGTAVSLGLVAGPVLGGLLSRSAGQVGTGDVRLDGYSVPFVAAGALAFGMFCVVWRYLPESRGSVSPPRGLRSTEESRPTGSIGLRPLVALVVASEFGLALFEGTFVLFAKDRLAVGPTRAAVGALVFYDNRS